MAPATTSLVLTLMAATGALEARHVATGREAARALKAEPGIPDWLSPGTACDIPIEGRDAAALQAAFAARFQGQPVDLAVQPAAGRRKRLMLADMDSTMVTGETLDEMAAHAGLKDVIAAITRRSMNGELDFPTALRERVAMLAGLPEKAIAATLAAMDYSPGAATAVATLRAHGCRCVLISGGFAPFTARVRAALGFDEDHANRLEMDDGKLTGRLVEPILDKDAKLATLRQRAADLGLGLDATLTVGDGANDLPMLTAASAAGGLGVAWRGKPAVAAQARFRLDHADLTGLLWLQGYREREVVRPG